MFGAITYEELDLMTLEQVRLWSRDRHKAATAVRATALPSVVLDAPGRPGISPLGPEADDAGEDDDFSWMDDMEAAGGAPF